MLNYVIWSNLSAVEQAQILLRPAQKQIDIHDKTKAIIDAVRKGGDEACRMYTQQFDQVTLTDIKVSAEEIAAAINVVSADIRQALHQAARHIEQFHQAQWPSPIKIETVPGITCELQYRALQKVGFYIPGGTACLPSTVLMLGIPAKLAKCQRRILCSPPQKDGSIHPAILYAAQLCQIEEIYKIGGAQAIAAMAYGTQSIPKVDKIYGPGNAWVTQAKMLVSQDPLGANLDMPAGPTEQMIIADHTANPVWVAADLLSQAEHGGDSQVILISNDSEIIFNVQQQISAQLESLPRRSIALKALQNSYAIEVSDLLQACEIANQYAPEHLLLQIAEPRRYAALINHAGSIFLGHYAPESVGDYATGTNHVLPTYGAAKSMSGLKLIDFMQTLTLQELTPEGLGKIAATVETLATLEGLVAHQRAVEVRNPHYQIAEEATDEILKLVRPEIRTLIPYSSARREQSAGEIFLNANESPWDGNQIWNRYPHQQPQELINELASLYQTAPMNMLVTRGSDEGIDLLVRAFCTAGQDQILITPPTYGMYEIAAQIQNAGVIKVPLLKDQAFELDVNAILKAWCPSIKLIFLCSPNNPTGNLLGRDKILTLCQQLKNKAMVVVDEAYIEFANVNSLIDAMAEYENLVVLRTLSKVHGLAAVRCGVILAQAKLIEILKKIIAPYPIPLPIVQIIQEALAEANQSQRQDLMTVILQQREFLMTEVARLPYVKKIWPSAANFLLLEVENAHQVIQTCLNKGIVIRDRSRDLNLQNCIRISVGTPQQNAALLEVLAHV